MVHDSWWRITRYRLLRSIIQLSRFINVRDGVLHGPGSYYPGVYCIGICIKFHVIPICNCMEVSQMIIRMKVKQREEQKGEEYEFKGPDAIDLTIETLLTKYGIRTRTFI